MSELLPINVVIGDRTYRLKIDKADEEVVRKTVKLISDKILEFRSQFAGKDMQDYVSMVLLWFATEQTKGTDHLPTEEISRALSGMEKLLEGFK